jgi:hypothetical protein
MSNSGREGNVVSAEQEKIWDAEFESIGEAALRAGLLHGGGVGVGISDEPKRQHAFRWLRNKERDRELREASARWYAKWTFWAAVGAVVIGLVTLFWH